MEAGILVHFSSPGPHSEIYHFYHKSCSFCSVFCLPSGFKEFNNHLTIWDALFNFPKWSTSAFVLRFFWAGCMSDCGGMGLTFNWLRQKKKEEKNRILVGLKNAGFKNEWLLFADPYCPIGERTTNAISLSKRTRNMPLASDSVIKPAWSILNLVVWPFGWLGGTEL